MKRFAFIMEIPGINKHGATEQIWQMLQYNGVFITFVEKISNNMLE